MASKTSLGTSIAEESFPMDCFSILSALVSISLTCFSNNESLTPSSLNFLAIADVGSVNKL